ncbi:MAG: hypothetical protein OER97_05890 [Gammaproteobacteria bacterium]|nr:hypothetical protein [Gammaproteobacteria bacterium]
MRDFSLFLPILAAALPLPASGQIALADSPIDNFVRETLEIHTRTSTCREEFDPNEALIKFDYAKGTMRKSEELDHKEPRVTNHIMTWQFPGFSLTSFTFFSFYGPSTWLRRLKISEPSELAQGVKFGDSVKKYAQVLEVSEELIRLNRVHVYRADVTFDVDDNDAVVSIIFECIAD